MLFPLISNCIGELLSSHNVFKVVAAATIKSLVEAQSKLTLVVGLAAAHKVLVVWGLAVVDHVESVQVLVAPDSVVVDHKTAGNAAVDPVAEHMAYWD